MDVILDSNVFRSDIPLKSDDVKILIDYLDKSKSSIIIPNVVLEEIKALYKKELFVRLNKFKSQSSNLDKILFNRGTLLPQINIDIEHEVNSYINNIMSKFQIDNSKIINYKDEYLSDIIKRATQRLKPCGDEGQGFRDAIIWLTLLDYGALSEKTQIAFISDNYTDFAADDKISLHQDLASEAQQRGVTVNYYRNISQFLSNHKSQVDYITEEWLKIQFDISNISNQIIDLLNKEDKEIKNWFNRRFSGDRERTDYFRVYEFELQNIFNYDVYELTNDEIIIKGEMAGEILIEIEFISLRENNSPYKLIHNPDTGELDMEIDLDLPNYDINEYKSQVEEIQPEIIFDVTLTIKDKIIKEFKINSFSLY